MLSTGGLMKTFVDNDIINKQCGKLTVKAHLGKKGLVHIYLCECECGNTKAITRGNLTGNHTKSCGCLKKRKGKESQCWSGHGEISGRVWSSIQAKAAQRDLPFSITIEEAWEQFKKQGGKCALTGWPISLNSHKGTYAKRTASLDRIENKAGYEKDNIQWLHKDVNWMKGKFSTSRFKEICEAVANGKKVQS
jgi:hypothetical protein